MSNKRISVVIRCLNEERHLGRLLQGIKAQTASDLEIIVVDSGSTDRSVSIAEAHGARIVTISPEEFSFGRSLNKGCAVATGDIIVVASAHVYPVCDSWLELLTAPFDNPAVGLTYGMQRGAATTCFSEHQVFKRWFPDTSCRDQRHPFCNNANAAIRRDLWQVQPYDESLTGLEDLDWAKRVMQARWRIAYVAEATVIHVHNESVQQVYNRYRREAIAYAHIMSEHRFGKLDLLRLSAANIMSDWFHAMLTGRFWRSFHSIPRFRLAQFWGTFQGSRHRGTVSYELRRRFYYATSVTRQSLPAAATDNGNVIDYDDWQASPEPAEHVA